ncbi:hypothetical protein GCM10010489_32730 [Microbacterium saperdae]|nr:hypothetical protein GCM10010489_32730 [Microbacterium saperdae]
MHMDLRDQDSTSTDGTTRRTIIRTAAWSVPVVAATIATPLAAASAPAADYAIESNFGSGWYPTTPDNASTGALQFDSDGADKYLRVTGTTAGDVIAGVHVNVLISSGWPAPAFTPLPGSNADWSTLADTGTTEVVNGVTYRVYLSSYSPPRHRDRYRHQHPDRLLLPIQQPVLPWPDCPDKAVHDRRLDGGQPHSQPVRNREHECRAR